MELELSREELRALAAELLARLTGAAPAEADSANRAPAEMGTAFPPDRTGGPGPISLLGGAGENPAAADFLSAGPDRTAGGVSGEGVLRRRIAGFPEPGAVSPGTAGEAADGERLAFQPPEMRSVGAVARVNALEEMSDSLRRDSRRYDAALEQY
jgi:hypothetical protein